MFRSAQQYLHQLSSEGRPATEQVIYLSNFLRADGELRQVLEKRAKSKQDLLVHRLRSGHVSVQYRDESEHDAIGTGPRFVRQ